MHLHHSLVPTTSFGTPCGTGGWTKFKSKPTYFAQPVEKGKEGTRGTVFEGCLEQRCKTWCCLGIVAGRIVREHLDLDATIGQILPVEARKVLGNVPAYVN